MEGSDEVLAKEPCPDCGSKDNLVRWADGHAKCFTPGCERRERAWHKDDSEGGATEGEPRGQDSAGHKGGLLKPLLVGAFYGIQKRGLDEATLRRFGYFRATYGSGAPVQVAPYHDPSGSSCVLQKLRFADKSFTVLKTPNAPRLEQCQLFGQSVWGDRYDKRVVVTEGEVDAMTVAQVMQMRTPCVSVNTGAAGAVKCLQANYRWLDRFGEIVLFFDDDAQGREAAEGCAKLFAIGKVRIARLQGGLNDASEAMQQGRPGDIQAAVYSAVAYKPRGIVNAADCIVKDFSEEDIVPPAWEYPWRGANDMLMGIRPGEVVYLVSGTSVGKSTAISEIKYNLLMGQPEGLPPCKIGDINFEASRKEAQLALLSVHMGRRLMIDPPRREVVLKAHEEVFGGRRVELFDPETAEWGTEAVLSYVRYMARALECNCIFIDPLSFLAAGLSLADDERRALDKASRDLAALAKELQVAIFVAHHLKRIANGGHEEGAAVGLHHVRGSGGLANFASAVIGLERNLQADDENARMIAWFRVLKNRLVGPTGRACGLRFDPKTGRLNEVPVPRDGMSSDNTDNFGEDF